MLEADVAESVLGRGGRRRRGEEGEEGEEGRSGPVCEMGGQMYGAEWCLHVRMGGRWEERCCFWR
eukprot:2077629-Rhodomonas_salina.2